MARAAPLLVGVDVGTTNIKAIVFDPTGQTVARASVPTPTHYPRPARAYYRPEELWQSTALALRQATGQLDDAGCVTGIAVASMAETAIPLDAGGRPTYDAIAWFDRRTQPQTEWLDQTIGRDRLFAISGLGLHPIFGLCKLLWLKENEPDAFRRTAHWLNVADYIAYRLSGVPATDYSLASRILALDLRELQWDEDLLREVGVPADLFARLKSSGTPLGPVRPAASEMTGLPTGTQVAVGGHDHVCGALAAGVTEPGTMLNSMGTAEAIFLPLERPLTDPEVGRQGYTQGVHVFPGHYYVFGGLYTSGASVDWFRDVMGSELGYDTLVAEAEEAPPGSLGAFFLPHLRLANPPYDDPKARGAFIGLSTDIKRGALFRSLLEGLAFESRNSLESLLSHAGVSLRNVYAIGGGTRNELLMRIKATVLNYTITVAGVEEATALGAAILGGVGAGVYDDIPFAVNQLRYTQADIEPAADQVAAYGAYFREVYQPLYPTLRSLHHTIHRLQNEAQP
ncbi:MAG: Xylulose kinase [Anaerolineales bacterium]|nr:Xylulose kinase [Anaerolineales bacterium]